MARKNVKELTDKEVLTIIDKEVSRIGYRLMAVRELKHKDDYYLRYVIAQNESKEEYATWLFNLELGGLHYGHYFTYWLGHPQEKALENAWEDFNER